MRAIYRKYGMSPVERRKDSVTSDIIQVGLMFTKIFGRKQGHNYFEKTIISPRIYQRIVLGIYSGTGPRQGCDPTHEIIS
jgi:hypothetical protein